ncbi:MAG TPA: sigma-54 dependent transcriptional regulator [Gemmatimonadales bacterium]|nr:sigma-54 dependent transcriptional regulator [Gemmatimonadales bacterium]
MAGPQPERSSRSPVTRSGGGGRNSALPTLQQLTPDVKSSIRILIVDDERTLRESCASVLQYEGYQVSLCSRGEEAKDLLRRTAFDIVLLDLYMSEVPGMKLLRTCLDAHPGTIAIMITGNPSVETSLEALRAGAWDYLPKPFSATHLQILIGRAAHAVMVAHESSVMQAAFAREHGNSDLVTVLGAAPVFKRAVDLAQRVAPTDASVFITGESGCGKELIAQFIHHHSRRSSRPLVAVNCAALPEPLLESEMFGHVKGAFTGAVRDKPGLLEAANGGTLLLDELVEMPKSIQAKLLRVIQDGVVRRVGSENTDAVVNVRFLACTNRNPEEAVQQHQLREDLYYRLRVVPIHVPPLRERPTDIPLLADFFLSRYWMRHRSGTTPLPKFSEAAVRALRARPWKGNVRELQNVVEHMVVLLEPGAEIRPEDIPAMGDRPAEELKPWAPAQISTDEPYYAARDRLVAEFELHYLTQVITQAGGNMSKAARVAGVDRTTLYRLMERHGLDRRVINGAGEPATQNGQSGENGQNGSAGDTPS